MALNFLGIYILSTEFIASFSVATTVMILNLHYRGFKINQVPKWLRKLTFGFLARVTCMAPLYGTDGKLLHNPAHNHLPTTKTYRREASKVYRNHNAKYEASSSNHADCTVAEAQRQYDLEEFRRLITFANNNPPRNYAQMSYESTQSTNPSVCNSVLSGTVVDSSITARISRLLDKFDGEKRMEENLAEWRRVAEILDRFSFYVFLLLICFTTIGILVISPFSRPEYTTLIRKEPTTKPP